MSESNQAHLAKNEKRAAAGRANGKLGGRPSGLVVRVCASGRMAGEIRRNGLPCLWSDPAPVYQGGGWWLFTHPDGKRWIVDSGSDSIQPGEYVGKYVPKGRTPYEAIRLASVSKKGTSRIEIPDFRRLETLRGPAYVPGHVWDQDPLRVQAVVARHWEHFGRREWERAGWPMAREKTHRSMTEAMEVAGVVAVECGETWGEIAKAWVRRGRILPHIWGEGRRAWIAERLRREREAADPLAGFEV